MLKLAFYYCNYTTLGHSNGAFSLVKGLKNYFKDKIEIVVIESGVRQTKVFDFHKYAKFYFSPLTERGKDDYNPHSTIDRLAKARFLLLKEILDSFKPDVFVTEYYPFCRSLVYSGFPALLKYIKDKYNSKIVSSSSCLNWAENSYQLINDFYDSILFHFPKEFALGISKHLPEKGAQVINKILQDFSKKVFFTGFLFDKEKNVISKKTIANKLRLKNRKLIIVSRGGQDRFKQMILSALAIAKNNKNWFFLISTGPGVTKDEFYKYQRISERIDNTKVVKLIYPHFEDYLKASDLSINMGGYHTLLRLVHFNKPTIIIPLENTDQPHNADFFSKFIPCTVVKKEKLKPHLLEPLIRESLRPRKTINKPTIKGWFKGSLLAAKAIENLV